MRFTGPVPAPNNSSAREGVDVSVIAYDDNLNEVRVPLDRVDEATDRSSNFGIGAGGVMLRVDNGPLVAADAELRTANAGSLAAAVNGDSPGSDIYVDLSPSPVVEDMVDYDERYHLDVEDGRLVPIVTERYPNQPIDTSAEIAASLARVVEAYGCEIART